jgi:hypothetical protein
MDMNRREALASGLLLAASSTAQATPAKKPPLLAPRPPMGWNSWNSFATTITEAQARETAQIMARELLPFGYDVFTVDIQWYEPNASSYTYASEPQPAMDAYGRLIPAPNRFPSSADGSGFTRLAAEVHKMGMKFGIHLMRGIPRLAVKRNLPVLGALSRRRHRRHLQHLSVEPGHVWRGHDQTRRPGILRQRLRALRRMGRGFRQDGRYEPPL